MIDRSGYLIGVTPQLKNEKHRYIAFRETLKETREMNKLFWRYGYRTIIIKLSIWPHKKEDK